MIDNTMDVVVGRASQAKVNVVVRYDSFCTRNPKITSDKERIRQVMVNIIDNAIKYSPKYGTVQVLVAKADSIHMSLRIVDEGTGIDDKKMKQLFEPFVQGSSAKEGSGLGLPMVYVSLLHANLI